MLEPGTRLQMRRYGRPCVVDRLIGSGGQGEVYVATVGSDTLALKWYYPYWATDDQRRVLAALTEQDPPNECFLWPIDLVEREDDPGFGYLMKIRPPRFVNVTDLMSRRVQCTFRTVVTVAVNLVSAFLSLHASGLCYRDINFGNVFLDPRTGDVLIADNDNVGIDGQSVSGVRGTELFMAPEVVRGDSVPSTATDLYSLSVLLFYLLMVHHPLNGRREADVEILDRAAIERLHGHEAVFIFDPDDTSNAPLPGVHDNALTFWPIYPQEVRDRFTEAFTVGLRDPRNGRVPETVWRRSLLRLRNHLTVCDCGAELFWDQRAGRLPPCWNCGAESPEPPRLVLSGPGMHEHVVIGEGARLYRQDLGGTGVDLGRPVAEVRPNPKVPELLGLTNLTTSATWTAITADNRRTEVEPGRSIRLDAGTRIVFGEVTGSVVHAAG